MIVSTVRVLLLTICDEIISPSAVYASPPVPDEGPAPTIVDTVEDSEYGSAP